MENDGEEEKSIEAEISLSIINMCNIVCLSKKGRALHAQILKITYSSYSSCFVYLANSLVNFYAKCVHLQRAKLVFDHGIAS